MTKDQKTFNKFKSQYPFIFKDEYLLPLLKNHFDSDCTFLTFTIALIENAIGHDQLATKYKLFNVEWSKLFCSLYENKEIISIFSKLEINPIIPFQQINDLFDCFYPFIDKLIEMLNVKGIDLKINDKQLRELLKAAYGYLLYNHIDCKIPYHFKDILLDNEYDTKFTFILNNTKLFSMVKTAIIKTNHNKINNLIVLLLGMSNKLNLDK